MDRGNILMMTNIECGCGSMVVEVTRTMPSHDGKLPVIVTRRKLRPLFR